MSKHPDDLRFTKEHEWIRVSGKTATVGITQFAVDQLGDITQVDLPKEGETVSAGQVLATVESVKAVSDIYAPVSGKIVKVNGPLSDSPETLNEDCYDEGWMVEIELSKDADPSALMASDQYEAYLAEQE